MLSISVPFPIGGSLSQRTSQRSVYPESVQEKSSDLSPDALSHRWTFYPQFFSFTFICDSGNSCSGADNSNHRVVLVAVDFLLQSFPDVLVFNICITGGDVSPVTTEETFSIQEHLYEVGWRPTPFTYIWQIPTHGRPTRSSNGSNTSAEGRRGPRASMQFKHNIVIYVTTIPILSDKTPFATPRKPTTMLYICILHDRQRRSDWTVYPGMWE